MKLLFNAAVKFLIGMVFVFALLFRPAQTLRFPNAWLFFGLLFIPMLIVGIILFIKSPALLAKRLRNKEKQAAQKGIVALSGLIFLGGFVISALDFRFSWSRVPTWLVILASFVFLIGYAIYAEVMRENAYLSRTVEVNEGQTVIDTGLYGVVRHPMYLATLFMFLSIPLILGSFYGLIPFLLYPVIIVLRIFDEERLLSLALDGYTAYKKRVKYRLIPFVF